MADNDLTTGNLGLTFNANTDPAVANLGKVTAAINKAREATERYNHSQHGTFEGGVGHGVEHAFNRLGRGAGLGPLGSFFAGGIGGGIGAVLGMGLIESVTSAYEKFRQGVEEAGKAFAESVKSAESQTAKGFSQTGADARTVLEVAATVPVSVEKAGEVISKVRSRNRGATDAQLIEAVRAIQENAPTAKGGEELIGEMERLGIDLGEKGKNFGELVNESGNRPEDLANMLRKNGRFIKSHHLDAMGAAMAAARVLNQSFGKKDEKEEEKARDRAFRKLAETKSGELGQEGYNGVVPEYDEQKVFRSNEELQDYIKQKEMKAAIDGEIADKRKFAIEVDKRSGGDAFGQNPKDIDKWITDNSYNWWTGQQVPFQRDHFLPGMDILGTTDFIDNVGHGIHGWQGPVSRFTNADSDAKAIKDAADAMKDAAHNLKKTSTRGSHDHIVGSGE